MVRPLLIPGEASFPDRGIIAVGLRVSTHGDPSTWCVADVHAS